MFLVNICAWLVGAQLMAYEYKKRLSEAVYAHWLFWSTMCLDNAVFLALNYSYYENYLILINAVSLSVNV